MCFFFNATATPEIYTLSLHDALPICSSGSRHSPTSSSRDRSTRSSVRHSSCRSPESHSTSGGRWNASTRSEEHTSELQSQSNLVCRLLLEKKKYNTLDRNLHKYVYSP